eukprot:6214550-Pleurochrysis_carterae.AAC.3
MELLMMRSARAFSRQDGIFPHMVMPMLHPTPISASSQHLHNLLRASRIVEPCLIFRSNEIGGHESLAHQASGPWRDGKGVTPMHLPPRHRALARLQSFRAFTVTSMRTPCST